jgi:hypothetical protein
MLWSTNEAAQGLKKGWMIEIMLCCSFIVTFTSIILLINADFAQDQLWPDILE